MMEVQRIVITHSEYHTQKLTKRQRDTIEIR